MNDLQKSAVIATLVKAYREKNLFCGETHVQKSVFLMQELLNVPLGFDFLLYKYGPFSFDLQQHLATMRADDMLSVRPLEYAATFEPGDQTRFLEKNLPNTIARYRSEVNFAVERLGGLTVKQLEPLSTALYFTRLHPKEDVSERAARIREVKPHIPREEAEKAVKTIDEWQQ